MDASFEDAEPRAVAKSSRIKNSDQLFLLHFIIGIYFGPDLKGDGQQKSVLQRVAERLPMYSLDQLAGTYLKTADVERVYYHVLRKADQSLIVSSHLLRSFFNGNLSTSELDNPVAMLVQFPNMFPPELHAQSKFNGRYKIIENIVFINDPDPTFIKTEDVERFKTLTGLENLLLDTEVIKFHKSLRRRAIHSVNRGKAKSDQTTGSAGTCRGLCGSKSMDCILYPVHLVYNVAPLSSMPNNGTPPMQSHAAPQLNENDSKTGEDIGPGMIYLPSCQSKDDWAAALAASKSGFALTGSAAMGHVGPIIGKMDIGECDDAYLFRVSLPGVKRDEREFSCKVETNGKVIIQGVTTTGERTVYRFSQVFEMLSKNLCPPGQFSIEFQLPGPVNPEQFSGNLGTDGVLEGIVKKRRHND